MELDFINIISILLYVCVNISDVLRMRVFSDVCDRSEEQNLCGEMN
jgi:hypothetical protein